MTFDASELFLGFPESCGRPAQRFTSRLSFTFHPLDAHDAIELVVLLAALRQVLQYNPPLTNLAALYPLVH